MRFGGNIIDSVNALRRCVYPALLHIKEPIMPLHSEPLTLLALEIIVDPSHFDHGKAKQTALFDSTVLSHKGNVLEQQGNHCWAAFPTAATALAAACDLNQTMLQDTTSRLSARIALHTGPTTRIGTTLVGITVTRLQHLLAVAQPGQILLSQQVHTLLALDPPADMELRNLGQHRLTDLARPEPLFAVDGPTTKGDVSPLRTLDTTPNNLPVQTTPFRGREDEIRAIHQLLQQENTRLVTYVATSGTGKTRFSLQVVAALHDAYPDGVYFVNLAPINDPRLVISAIAQVLGLKEGSQHSLFDTLVTYLRNRRVLLLLDNFEQVVAAGPDVANLLQNTERLDIIVTSHLALGIDGEQVVYLAPLALPDPDNMPPLEQLSHNAAVALFVDGAQTSNPNFMLTEDNAAVIAELCGLLNGLPLALELVAAHVDEFTPEQLLVMLKTERDTENTVPLRTVLEWSYNQLSPTAQALLTRLGIFVGGCILEAAEVVCQVADDDGDVLDAISTLLQRHLLLEEELAGNEQRYIMLDCIHEFAQALLAASNNEPLLQSRHAAYYLELAETSLVALRSGQQQEVWLSRLEGEHNNLRAVFRRSLDQGYTNTALQLCGALTIFWGMHGHISEGLHWIEETLAQADPAPSLIRARAMNVGCILANTLGYAERAEEYGQAGLVLFQQLEEPLWSARILNNLGLVARDQGNYAVAKEHYSAGLSIAEQVNDSQLIGIFLNNLGVVSSHQGDYVTARQYYETALHLQRQRGDKSLMIHALINLGALALDHNQPEDAAPYLYESLQHCQALGGHEDIVLTLEAIAHMWAMEGKTERAAQLFGAAEVRREVEGNPVPPGDRAEYDRQVAAAQSQLDEDTFTTAWTVGRAMQFEQVLKYVLEGVDDLVAAAT